MPAKLAFQTFNFAATFLDQKNFSELFTFTALFIRSSSALSATATGEVTYFVEQNSAAEFCRPENSGERF